MQLIKKRNMIDQGKNNKKEVVSLSWLADTLRKNVLHGLWIRLQDAQSDEIAKIRDIGESKILYI